MYHLPPTKKELEQFPSLADAWNKYVMIRKLTLGNDGTIPVPPITTIDWNSIIVD